MLKQRRVARPAYRWGARLLRFPRVLRTVLKLTRRILPDLGSLSQGVGLAGSWPALLWIAGALFLAHARVLSVVARGRWPSGSSAPRSSVSAP